MKKKFFYLAALILIAISFTSCKDIINCENCRYNVYVNDVFSYSEFEAEYCGADLVARKAAPDVVIGQGTATVTATKFECD